MPSSPLERTVIWELNLASVWFSWILVGFFKTPQKSFKAAGPQCLLSYLVCEFMASASQYSVYRMRPEHFLSPCNLLVILRGLDSLQERSVYWFSLSVWVVNVKKFEILHQLDTSFMANFNCVSNFLLFDIYVFENDGKLIEFWTGTKSEASSEKEELFSSSSSLLFSPKKVIVFFFLNQLSFLLFYSLIVGMEWETEQEKSSHPLSVSSQVILNAGFWNLSMKPNIFTGQTSLLLCIRLTTL